LRLRRIDNYLILAQIRPFAAILAVLVSLFAGYSLAGILGDAVGALLPAAVIAELTLLKVLIALDVLIPIALFFAVLLAFGRLQSDGEASAMLALGISPLRLARPVLGVAAVVALAVAALSLFVRPWAYGRSHIVSRHAAVVTNVNAMQAGTFYASQDGSRVVFLGARSGPGAPAQGVFVARSAGDHLEVIAAGSAQPAADDGSGHRAAAYRAAVFNAVALHPRAGPQRSLAFHPRA
jgi:lipopolysaccharide export system permease protein